MPKKVLIVDDEDMIRVIAKSFLESEGYAVETAANYQEAMQVLEETEIDLIVSDIVMGPETGIDLLRELKKRELRCPIVIITGNPDITTASDALRLGAFDYIVKPFKKDNILHVVQQALRHKTLDDERERYRRNLEAIVKSVQEGIITIDTDLTVTEANDAVEHFLHKKPSAIIGKSLESVTADTYRPCLQILQNTLNSRDKITEQRVEWKHGNGRQQIVMMNSAPLIDRGGAFMGAVLVMRDESRLVDLERELHERQHFHKIVGKSKPMQKLYGLIEALGETETTVLITGPSGTGKELAAEAIHYSGSRALKPLVKVNCTALAENLLESELFGHVAGAFTGATKDKIGRFQMADGGTVFLDEIGDISPALQVKLLRILQEKEFERVGDPSPIKVDVRVLTATNSNLRDKITQGSFREDLYYRLNVMEIQMPPLAERLDDIPLLIDHFCSIQNKKMHKSIKGVSDTVMHLFLNYAWPGNIRELQHVIERAFILCRGNIIDRDHIPAQLAAPDASAGETEGPRSSNEILQALEKTKWHKSKAAKLLGMSRPTLYKKMKELNLDSPE